ncbi:SdrH family protein [Staphylococcus schweitzeri]|uniref:SdrH family protein n=1 Tax=Staphylococcus schweitzeri TaxID=1654388 RepID=UPI0005055F69|nr:SdrH family protein [Staphylococcus schweitzeri]CDR26393.1 membrane anchored protein [Staphylococcus schweitzeri]
MTYHWVKKMLLSTSIFVLSNSGVGIVTHTAEAKTNVNEETATTNMNGDSTSTSPSNELNESNIGAGTPHQPNQTDNGGTDSNNREANPDSSQVNPDNSKPKPNPDPDKPKPDPDKPKPNPDQKPDPDKPKPNPDPNPDPDKPKPNPDPKPDPDKPKPNPDPKPDPNKPNPNPNQPGGSNHSGGSKNGGTWNPNASNGSNQGQWQPNGNQGDSPNPNNNDFVSQRFLALANGAYKYNPYILNQINKLGKGYGEVTDEDIYNIIRKQNFSGNAYLNGLQQQSNYFRFQYFNPLKSERYYRNLDEQVLALITGEIGSMPDLKKPEEKTDTKHRAFKPHEKDDFTVVKKQEESKKSATTVYSKSWIAIICSMILIFTAMILFIIKRHKKQNKNESQRL